MTRICTRCRRAAAVPDGRECHECLLITLRETRPAWLRWTEEHRNAKDLTRAA